MKDNQQKQKKRSVLAWSFVENDVMVYGWGTPRFSWTLLILAALLNEPNYPTFDDNDTLTIVCSSPTKIGDP